MKFAAIALLLLFNQVPAVAEIPAGQYTVLPRVYFDTDLGSIVWLENGSRQSGSISDCSDSALHCLESEELSLVWPRRCGVYVRDDSSWSLGGVTTRVVGFTTRTIHHSGLTARLPLIMTVGRPNMAFVLDNGRIRGVLFMDQEDADLRSTIASNNSEDKFDLIDAPPPNAIYAPVLSSRWLGKCES